MFKYKYNMNPTNPKCPPKGQQNGIIITDYRPSNTLYVNVSNSNDFRAYLQNNANKIRAQNLKAFEDRMGCFSCEGQPKGIKPFKAKRRS